MIQFYSTADLRDQPIKKDIVYEVVRTLQKTFGECQCDCHPNYQWAVGCEIAAETLFVSEVVTSAQKPCTYIKEMLSKEIIPFVQELSTQVGEEKR